MKTERDSRTYASFSGGRSSAFMLRRLLDKGVHLDAVIFNNTGMETAETYAFVDAVDEQWLGGQLVRLEYWEGDVRRVSADQMMRGGEPFMSLIETKKRLPSFTGRVCTGELKINSAFRWWYSQCDRRNTDLHSMVGLRADEPRRIARIRKTNAAYWEREEQGLPVLKWSQPCTAPLADDGITRDDVMAWLKTEPIRGLPFDPSDPELRLSNCSGCFFSSLSENLRVCREHPEVAEWWDNLERRYHEIRPNTTPAGDARHAWARKHLNRELRPGFETHGFAIHINYTWSMLRELSEIQGGDRLSIVERFGVMESGGCGSQHCHTDI